MPEKQNGYDFSNFWHTYRNQKSPKGWSRRGDHERRWQKAQFLPHQCGERGIV